jgi:hypothetical protein
MNIVFLHEVGDPLLVLGNGVKANRSSVAGRNFDGFVLPGRSDGQLRLTSALRWHPFASRPIATDWLATAEGGPADLEVALVNENGDTVSCVVDRIGHGPSVVSLPALRGPSTLDADRSLDLVLRNLATDGSCINLLVKENDSADPFLTLAKGMGVELLNGKEKVLLPSPDRELFYVGTEAQVAAANMPLPPGGDRWSQALIGRSHDIQIVDHELDFVFANNILHRAVNPLGHLARWRTKLRAGGRVMGIVPYVAGGSEYLNAPTPMADWLAQYNWGGFEETQSHHNAFAHARGLNPKSLFRRGFASSFSFFTPSNVAEMLNFAIEQLGYNGLHIEHARNGPLIRFGLYV